MSLWTSEQLAERLGVPRAAIELRVYEGTCPIPFRDRPSQPMFHESDIRAYEERRRACQDPASTEPSRQRSEVQCR